MALATVIAAGVCVMAQSVTASECGSRLPRVLLIGDSISIGYTEHVKQILEGKADVHRIPENSRDTWYGLKKLDEWLGEEKWDVIHFNWGLHDLKYVKDGALDLTGTRATTAEDYEKNLEKLVVRLKATGAKLIWASTTPIPEGSAGRVKGEEIEFNKIAQKLMKEHGVAINDLHAHVLPQLDRYQQPHNVHFTQQGYVFLAEKVSAEISKALESQRQGR